MRRVIVLALLSAALIAAAFPVRADAQPPSAVARPIDEVLKEGFALIDADKFDPAVAVFLHVLETAKQSSNEAAEAEARRGLGLVYYERADYTRARAELMRALELFDGLSDLSGRARVERQLAQVAVIAGDFAAHKAFSERALADAEAIGDISGQAAALYTLTQVEQDENRTFELLERAERLAAEAANTRLRAGIVHALGDHEFARGHFDEAIVRLEQAIALYEGLGDKRGLARTLTSLGRLNRVHGHSERALPLYERALALQKEVGDQQGVIQSTNAIAIALGALNRSAEALTYFQRALALARETGSPRLVAFQMGNLGGAYVETGEYAKGASTLEEVLRQPLDQDSRALRLAQLSDARRNLGELPAALEALNESIALMRSTGSSRDRLLFALQTRALVQRTMGHPTESLADADTALELLEELRAHTIPTDFMKQGFGRVNQEVFSNTIGLLQAMGNDTAALERAEQARARALGDLLASRSVSDRSADVASTGAGPSAIDLTLRGGARAGPSPVATSAVKVDEMRATAERLRSTLVVYHVTDEATFVWTVAAASGKPIRARQIAVKAERLRELVRLARPETAPGTRGSDETPIETRGKAVPLATRRTSLRELYSLLVRPIVGELPSSSGGRVTIVPHGPLLLLSFAALQDEGGRYLLERWTLNYAPSAAVFGFTGRRAQELAGQPPRYLLVADPANMPRMAANQALPPLPGARREVAAIAGAVAASHPTVLEGRGALENAVRNSLRSATVVHFATHGIVRDDEPLDSFLALGRTNAADADDGRLTAAEIYELNLHADLVVLSACRTALGELSGEGIAGLTRAFLSAGSASVMATMWDVADEPTYRLVPQFYRSRTRGQSKAEALRSAQLRLLADLRAGRVKLGTLTLPEDPFFWAGFVLIGEP
jgi:CHAT domain-containing protein/tetratricopeptide (TPR) repeat protein